MRTTFGLMLALAALGCEDDTGNDNAANDNAANAEWQGYHAHTLKFGSADNSEVVKMLPDGKRAVLVASKARKITLMEVGTELKTLRETVLFADDTSESELTHIDFNRDGSFAVVTRTLPRVEGDTLVACEGELVFVDVSDSDTFGQILDTVPVGPMPDAVDISDNDRWVITADEVDLNDGKCPIEAMKPTVTVIELMGSSATVRAVITLDQAGVEAQREPEQVIIAADNTHVAVTLQDTHEVLFFSLAEILDDAPSSAQDLSSADPGFRLELMKNRDDGAEPWPDGVARFTDAAGQAHFVVAGEYNDTLHFYSLEGVFEHQHAILESNFPSDFPRNQEDWSRAPFRPDSLAPFSYNGHSYLAASLKHAGAVGVWDVSDLAAISLAGAVKIGLDEMGTPTTESSMGTEGISAGPGGQIVTANEGDSSASLVLPITE